MKRKKLILKATASLCNWRYIACSSFYCVYFSCQFSDKNMFIKSNRIRYNVRPHVGTCPTFHYHSINHVGPPKSITS